VSFDGRRSTQLDTSCLTGKRVLLAEDNLINQTVARKMLSSLGMSVEVAVNGLEALNAVQRCGGVTSGGGGGVTSDTAGAPGDTGFDIILMDMAMPVMGGVEATRAIRAAGHRLPIVAMTANASDKDRDECADSGMDGFLSKPVLREQLARALLAVLGPGAGAAGGVPPF
jgi:CheY-like chemotaxis protein